DIVEGLSVGADDFIVKPFRSAELLLRVRTGERLLSLETRDIAIFAMAKLAESRDKETGHHLERVRCYSQMLARQLMANSAYQDQIDDGFVRLMYETSPLHDIGKVGIPDSILLKPGKLTPEEWEIMKQHPTVGLSILDGSSRPILKAAAVIAHQHHEKYDGSGYPQGLKGEDIHKYARIVAVADVFDALSHKRCYKEAWPIDQVVGHLREIAGHHLDPQYVELLIKNIDKAQEINRNWPD
ncbi:MAG: HD domain-containing phosphohydrolase, partial [Telluria sp.]